MDLLHHFNFLTRILQVFGLWTPSGDSRSWRVRGFTSAAVSFTCNFLLPVINICNSEKIYEDAMISFFLMTVPAFRAAIGFYRMRRYQELLEKLRQLLEFMEVEDDGRLKLQNHGKFMVRLFKFFIGSICFSVLMGLSVPLLEGELQYKSWIPYENQIDDIRTLWTLSFLQALIAVVTSLFGLCLEMFPVFFFGIMSMLLAELSNQMTTLSEFQSEDHEKLIKCVEIHRKIEIFLKEIEKEFSILLFIQGFFSSALICFVTFVLSKVTQLIFPRLTHLNFSTGSLLRVHQIFHPVATGVPATLPVTILWKPNHLRVREVESKLVRKNRD
jgi:hypothetical protein